MFFASPSMVSAFGLGQDDVVPSAQDLALTSIGHHLDTSAAAFGELTESSHHLGDVEALHERFAEDGYLYLRGFFRRADVLDVRRGFADRLAALGNLEPGTDPMDAVIRRDGQTRPFWDGWGMDNPGLKPLLYSGRIMDFYRGFFGEAVRHFDFTWLRMIAPGRGTNPHCDVVYMGRGTREKLMTAWIPMGDVPLQVGGLMILEGSHHQHERLAPYLNLDVDAFCSNSPNAAKVAEGFRNGVDLRTPSERRTGNLTKNPVTLREKLGGRWLTTAFEAGDLVTFTMNLVHGSLDNQSDSYRISTDSRYQPASLPADNRWVGENPPGHGLSGKLGRIC